jgi:hypothetical protein
MMVKTVASSYLIITHQHIKAKPILGGLGAFNSLDGLSTTWGALKTQRSVQIKNFLLTYRKFLIK